MFKAILRNSKGPVTKMMEDLKTEKTSDHEYSNVKTNTQDEGRLTIMIMGSIGRASCFNISLPIIIWGTIFFLIYIPVSIFVINRYFDLHNECIIQSKRVNQLKRKHSGLKKTLIKSNQHVALLENCIHDIDTPKAKDSKSIGVPNEDKIGRSKGIVDVRDVVIEKKDSRVNIDLKVVNTRKGDGPVSGYVHMLARKSRSNPPQEWSCPKQKLRNGVPLNFRKGQRFVIERFKPIHGKFDLISGSETPSTILVFIYDRSGMLILKKRFEVSDGA